MEEIDVSDDEIAYSSCSSNQLGSDAANEPTRLNKAARTSRRNRRQRVKSAARVRHEQIRLGRDRKARSSMTIQTPFTSPA
jgi:hypothetical protein